MTDHNLDPIADRLRRERPVPSPGFRGDLRRRLSEQAPPSPAPARTPRLLVAAYAGSGALLLGVAAIGLAGIGPLAT